MSATARASRLPLALRFALRELRGGLKGFYVFIACIALGVAAIAAVNSVSRALQEGIAEQGQAILGGDVAASLVHRQAEPEERAILEEMGRVSEIATLRAMARGADSAGQSLAEMKAVDAAYPLYGAVEVEAGGDLDQLLAQRDDGRYGLIAEPSFAARLGIDIGEEVVIGEGRFVLTGLVSREPDRLSSAGVGWGPRVMLSLDALAQTGLVQPGSLVTWRYRIALPSPGDEAVAAAVTRLESKRAAAGWQVRDRGDAAPGLSQQIERFSMFLTMVGLTALIVGGIGVANAVSAYLDSRRATIATLKSVGATGSFIFRLYLTEIMLLAALAMVIGLALGAATPWLVGQVLSRLLPVADAVPGLYPGALAQALAYGVLTALAFALWPLGRAREVPVSALFRDHVASHLSRPRAGYIVALVLVVGGLAALAVLLAFDRWLALYFVAGMVAAFVVLRLVALGIMALARRAPRTGAVPLRLAIAAIHRPGAVTPSVVLSLGLGLTLLVTVALIDASLTRQFTHALPDRAPSFFFLDIPREDGPRFREVVNDQAPDGILEDVPMLRGSLVSLAGTPVSEIDAPPEAAWALRGDRGITHATEPPDGRFAAGSWWPPDYDGPPQVSFEYDLAAALGLDVGDTIEVNVLGRTIAAEIAALHNVEWASLAINFVLIFSPNTFAGAPYMLLSTVTLPSGAGDAAEDALMRAVTAEFPTVTSVRVKEALDSVNDLVQRLANAVRVASGFTIAAGVLVLAGALAASHRHRIHDAVVLKTLGARRATLVSAYALEFALIGAATSVFALGAGVLAAYVVVTEVMRLEFTLMPRIALAAVVGALMVTVTLGLAGTWRVLGRKPAAYLRDL